MKRKMFNIMSKVTVVLAMLVLPLSVQGKVNAPGPLPEPPGVGGGSPEKPAGDYDEYEFFPGDPAWLECERAGGGDYPYSVRIGTGSAIEPFGLTREVYGNTIRVEEIWEQGLEYPVAFNWYSDPYPIGIVIVKSGRAATIYRYEEEATFEDTGLTSVEPWEPSHLTFCWGEGDEPAEPPPVCEMVDETAWGDGYFYNIDEQGNWATYTPYPVIIDGVEYDGVILWAGQHMDAGVVIFSEAEDGTITMTFILDDVWHFALEEENVKIQPYFDEPPPDGNPVPGDFDYKYTAHQSPFVVEGLPRADYYGIHLDLEWES